MARLVAISYGGITLGLGGNASCHLDGKARLGNSYEEFSITFQVLVQNATRATFLTAEAALLAAFRKPDQDLSVQLAGSNRFVFTQAGNTGMNARATARKIGGDEDTANSALYECTVTVRLPADLTGKSGRQSASEELTEDASGRRFLRISGTYTALSTNGATAQYVAAADTYSAAVLSNLGLSNVVDLVDEQWTRDHNDKSLSFVRRYEEILYQQGTGATDVASIKGTKLLIGRANLSADASPEYGAAAPLTVLAVEYETAVDQGVTQDLLSLWEGTIRPNILAAAASIAGVAPVIVRESPRFDLTGNRVSASMELVASASGIVFARVEYEDDVTPGRIFVPVWDGNPYSRDDYQGPASHIRRMSTLLVMLRGTKPGNPTPPDGSGFLPAGGASFHEVRALRRVNHFNRGVIGGGQLALVAITLEQVWVRADLSAAGPPAVPDTGGSRVRDVDPEQDLGA